MYPILHEFLRDPTPYFRHFTKTLGRRKVISMRKCTKTRGMSYCTMVLPKNSQCKATPFDYKTSEQWSAMVHKHKNFYRLIKWSIASTIFPDIVTILWHVSVIPKSIGWSVHVQNDVIIHRDSEVAKKTSINILCMYVCMYISAMSFGME